MRAIAGLIAAGIALATLSGCGGEQEDERSEQQGEREGGEQEDD